MPMPVTRTFAFVVARSRIAFELQTIQIAAENHAGQILAATINSEVALPYG